MRFPFAALAAAQILAHAAAGAVSVAPAPVPVPPRPAARRGAAAHGRDESAPPPSAEAEPEPVLDSDEGDDEAGGEGESSASDSQGSTRDEGGSPGRRYSGDLSDAELARLWKADPSMLGTISVGFADQGRVINAQHLADTEAWTCARRDLAWGTQETLEALAAAFNAVHAQFPRSAPARLSHIGAHEGGYLRPHRSHQSGRDADIGFFYRNDAPPGRRARPEKLMDPARNWALIRALVTGSDVQLILVDRSIQRVLRDYAVANGEDRAWVDQLFRGKGALIQHARHHRDHFHVRFWSPRSQELGRRIQPLLAQRPDQNVAVVRVKRGQTLSHLARIHNTTVPALLSANHLRKPLLHAGQQLRVPLRGPCTHCPLPPEVLVPPRHLPPDMLAASPQTGREDARLAEAEAPSPADALAGASASASGQGPGASGEATHAAAEPAPAAPPTIGETKAALGAPDAAPAGAP